jgi:putative Holliday junction resolvase
MDGPSREFPWHCEMLYAASWRITMPPADSTSSHQSPVTNHRIRIAGIDYGTVRIGIALADLEVRIAGPYENYTRRTPQLDAEYFAQLAEDEQIGRFVVGLPVHLGGGESQKSTEAREFGNWLGNVTGVPVEYFDERFTTAEADELLGQRKLTKKQRQARRDQLAAQIMLTAYLEAGARGQDVPGAID